MNFVEDRTEHRFPLFRTDIDVIRSEDLMESVLMEKFEGVYLKLTKETVHKLTVEDSFNFSQFNSSSILLR